MILLYKLVVIYFDVTGSRCIPVDILFDGSTEHPSISGGRWQRRARSRSVMMVMGTVLSCRLAHIRLAWSRRF